jgi:hypothetical protein
MNRREVVEGLLLASVAGGTVAAASGSALRVAATLASPPDRQIVVFDRRFVPAQRFAAAAAAGAWRMHSIAGDVTALWHDLLAARWHHHAHELRGMTTPQSFTCLEQLVADRFWRATVVWPNGELVRWTLAPRRMPS